MPSLVLTAEQKLGLAIYDMAHFMILLGGPGTGKTHWIREVLVHSKRRTLIVAPTGSAAERLSEVTGQEAFIIQYVLSRPELSDSYRGASLIVDEGSMVSINMMRELIRKISPARVLIVGDTRQMPCQEGYSVLCTMERVPRIPILRLTQNHRQKEGGALMRTIMNFGKGLAPETDEKFQVFPCSNNSIAFKKAVECYKAKQATGAQMIAFKNDLCDALNNATSQSSTCESLQSGIFVGDRIVCTENCYNSKTKVRDVSNGTIGTVTSKTLITYNNGFLDKRKARKGFASVFKTARAMTVHKAQGSEFNEHGILLLGGWNRPPAELMFTAISRFRGHLHVFGTPADIRDAFSAKFSPKHDEDTMVQFAEGFQDRDEEKRRKRQKSQISKNVEV